MKKVFISQPMNGKTDQEILQERDSLIALTKNLYGEDLEFIQSLITEEAPEGTNKPLWYLGVSLQKLSEADFAVFGEGWQDARGCAMEYDACTAYKIPIKID